MGSPVPAFASVPVNRFLGFKLVRRSRGKASISFRPGRPHAQEYGVVHGGILSTLADTAAVYTIQPTLGKTERMTSIEFKINFLAGARPGRGDVVARATLVRKGRTVAVAHVDLHQEGVHVAVGLFTYVIFRPDSASAG